MLLEQPDQLELPEQPVTLVLLEPKGLSDLLEHQVLLVPPDLKAQLVLLVLLV